MEAMVETSINEAKTKEGKTCSTAPTSDVSSKSSSQLLSSDRKVLPRSVTTACEESYVNHNLSKKTELLRLIQVSKEKDENRKAIEMNSVSPKVESTKSHETNSSLERSIQAASTRPLPLPLWATRNHSEDVTLLLDSIEKDIDEQKRIIFSRSRCNIDESIPCHVSPEKNPALNDKTRRICGSDEIPTLCTEWAESYVKKLSWNPITYKFVSNSFFDVHRSTIQSLHKRFEGKMIQYVKDAEIFMERRVSGLKMKNWFTTAVFDLTTGTIYNAKGGKCEERNGLSWYHTPHNAVKAARIIIYAARGSQMPQRKVPSERSKNEVLRPENSKITWVLDMINGKKGNSPPYPAAKEVILQPFLECDI